MADSQKPQRFATRCVHAGQAPDPATGAIMTPVYFTSTYVQEAPNVHKGYDYSRADHPTRAALEGNLASLEDAHYAVAFASGVGAMDAILKRLRPGDHVVSSNDLYGGSFRLFTQIFAPYGIQFSFVDMRDLSAVEAVLRPTTKLVWIETPTNPLLRIVDIAAVSALARTVGAWVAVDNTFATPVLQQPLSLGADLVMHSATKYLGGHSDVILGCVMTSDREWNEALRFQLKATGASPGPMDCFLVLRGTKTLHLRVARHCENGARVARFLADHPAVEEVYFPGLETHEGHEIASRQMSGFGGMLSFVLRDDTEKAAVRVVTSTKVFALAESLGGVESLIEHPASMTHASIPAEECRKAGFRDSLIRLSVGVEDVEDLIEDLAQALD
ncbi:MAG TPA: cystathionine gamma-synthase [Rhodothermales bacterium]|nr:cystathionine gamma-synthase [Rhodothermales bacterium]